MRTEQLARLERITAATQHVTVALQLIAGATIILLIDTNYYQDMRAGIWFDPPWLSVTIPIAATALWFTAATWSVRHLWHVWQGWRTWKAHQRALSATSPQSPRQARQARQAQQPETWTTLPPLPPLP